jgi:hypothetical protein
MAAAELQAGKTTTKNRHTQETKGTNEHDKKEPKKGTVISLKTSINTRRWPNWAETCCEKVLRTLKVF